VNEYSHRPIAPAQLRALFQETFGRPPAVMTRAPGRIEFIGNHTDYNGGTVLGASIDRGVWVALAPRTDGERHFRSGVEGRLVTVTAGRPARKTGSEAWVNYPLGVQAALPAFGLRGPDGFDCAVLSDLPAGAGLSSSAALELASGLAFLAAAGLNPPREVLVEACRKAENDFVGVPCGILDQAVAGLGRQGHLVFIDCRGPRFELVPLPAEAHFWVFNTATQHALVDGFYATRHRECMEAAQALGVERLADVTLEALAAGAAKLTPVAAKRARHVVEEIARVGQTMDCLRAGDLAGVGRLLTASHRSSQTLFENSTPELDFLVDTLVDLPHVYGARLTGGGFGGAAMALTGPEFGLLQARQLAADYARRFGRPPGALSLVTGPGVERV
jgi:galactokinase